MHTYNFPIRASVLEIESRQIYGTWVALSYEALEFSKTTCKAFSLISFGGIYTGELF